MYILCIFYAKFLKEIRKKKEKTQNKWHETHSFETLTRVSYKTKNSDCIGLSHTYII